MAFFSRPDERDGRRENRDDCARDSGEAGSGRHVMQVQRREDRIWGTRRKGQPPVAAPPLPRPRRRPLPLVLPLLVLAGITARSPQLNAATANEGTNETREERKVASAPASLASRLTAPPADVPLARRLVSQLRLAYLTPCTFSATALRYPLRVDLENEFRAARRDLETNPTAAEVRYRVAQLAEEAEDPQAEAAWRAVLEQTEERLKLTPADPHLRRQHVEALVGAGAYAEAVPAAQALVQLDPALWRHHLLLGDALLLRADYAWRVLVAAQKASQPLPAPERAALNADLQAAAAAYGEAVTRAPAEAAPRGARIHLQLLRPLLGAFLPAGVLVGGARPDPGAVLQDLLEWVLRNPGQVAPLWHTALAFATPPFADLQLTAAEQGLLDAALARAPTAGPDAGFVNEARGFLAVARAQWAEARTCFGHAAQQLERHTPAAEWWNYCEWRAGDPPAELQARLRCRLQQHPRAAEWTALGLLLAAADRHAAVAAFREALVLDVDHAAARYNLGVLLLQLDPDSEEARHHLNSVAETEPDDREVQFADCIVLALAGEKVAAARALQELLRLHEVGGELRERVHAALSELR